MTPWEYETRLFLWSSHVYCVNIYPCTDRVLSPSSPISVSSSSPQHIEECCGWLKNKLEQLNEEQNHIVQTHQDQVKLSGYWTWYNVL